MVALLPRNKSKVKSSTAQDSLVIPSLPDNWEDFARLCKIRSGNKVINFEPYEYQTILSNLIDSHYGTVVAKTRQLGVTETVASKFLFKACRNVGYVAVVLSKSQVDSSNIARRIRGMGDSLKAHGVQFATDSLLQLEIKNGGRILFRPSTANGVRGLESVSDILFDECAFVDVIDRIYTSALPSTELLGDEARIILLSTPGGKSGFFWDKLASNNGNVDVESICSKIKLGESPSTVWWTDTAKWCKFITHWKAHPVYSQIPDYLEKLKVQKQLTDSAIAQEYDLSFEESEVNVFNGDLVRVCAVGQYEGYQAGYQYYVGIDTSNQGDDNTVAIVIKVGNQKISVVNLYQANRKSMDYNIEKISEYLNHYHPVKVGVETTGGTGQVYLEQLSKVYNSTAFIGVKTTGDTKPVMIDRVVLAVEKGSLVLPKESPLYDEMLMFRRSGKKQSAPSGKHDDCVMALSFALSLCTSFDQVKYAPNLYMPSTSLQTNLAETLSAFNP